MLERDFFIRINNASEVGKMLEALSKTEQLTERELIDIGGNSRSAYLLRVLAKNSDNLRISRDKGSDHYARTHTMQYVDVVGRAQTVVNVESADFSGGAFPNKATDDAVEVMRWPNAPRLLNLANYDFFRKPSWYNTMKAMVAAGSHISFSGPPSVGKDTAVEYLAAEVGVPLVVVNGDGGLRRRDILGSAEMQNGTSHFDIAEAAAAMINGWWLLITEVNAADPDVLLLLNGVLAPPHMISIKGRQYPVHPNFRLFISYNPGLVGTKPLPQSFKDRFFPIQIDFLTTSELRSRLEAHGMPEVNGDNTMLVNGQEMEKLDWPGKVVSFGMSMWKAHTDGKFRYQISVRRLIDAIKLMNMDATGGDCKKALQLAVLSTIDSPVEQREAKKILDGAFPNW